MINIDFLRAMGVWTVGFFASIVVGYVVDPTGIFATVRDNIILTITSIPLLAGLTYWYFATPALKPSARAGFQLGAVMLVISFIFGALGAVVFPAATELPPIPYEGYFLLVCVAIGLAVPALVGWYMAKRA